MHVTAKLTVLPSFLPFEQLLYLHLSTFIVGLQDTEHGG
jgi:hypothetical protein